MRWFVRQSTKRGKVCSYNQYEHSKSFDNVLKCLANELNGDIESSTTYDIIEKFLYYTDQQKKIYAKESKGQIQDYRGIVIDEKHSNMNEKSSDLPVQQKLSQYDLSDLLIIFVATSLSSSAKWDDKSIYPKIETVYAFTIDMNYEFGWKSW